MSQVIDEAVRRLTAKVGGAAGDLGGSVKFVLTGEGSILLDADGVRAGDDAADVSLTADPEVFQAMLEGETSAVSAFMSGKLKVDGDMGLAMKLGKVLG
jgi:putative sterol carrier protein